jgi:NAD(P)-dependent dehydrogenase (short-subunit alcohol dehydrogenase family)
MSDARVRTVLVTGASTGIGRAIAERLDRAGYRVFAGIRSEEAAAALRAAGSARLTPVRLDITVAADIAACLQRLTEALGSDGGLDGLVNNAGVVSAVCPMEFVPLEAVRRQFEINVMGHVAVTQAMLPLIRRVRGRIVNIGSASGRLAMPFLGPYAATKHALEALSDVWRRELGLSGIRVALVQPGLIDTPMWQKGAGVSEAQKREAPPEARALYGEALDNGWSLMLAETKRAVGPDTVARVVQHALEARHPRTRYPVGPGARTAVFSRFLPDGLVDRISWFALRHGTRRGAHP